MSHRGIPARDIDKFDEASLRGLPSESIGAKPIVSLRTVLTIIAVAVIAAAVFSGIGHR